MRLIDAEVFEKSVRTDFWEHYTNCHDTDQTDLLELIMDNLAECPTIEAKPVVHAHWIKHREFYEDEGFEGYYYSCSNCDGTLYGDVEGFNFCHCCGAQMDESISCGHEDDNNTQKTSVDGVKIPVISMEDVPKVMEELKKSGKPGQNQQKGSFKAFEEGQT